jgi:hypothetical protein
MRGSWVYNDSTTRSETQLSRRAWVRPDFVGRCERRPPPPEHTTLGHPLPCPAGGRDWREGGRVLLSIGRNVAALRSQLCPPPLPPGGASFASSGLRERGPGGEVVVAAHPKLPTELGQTRRASPAFKPASGPSPNDRGTRAAMSVLQATSLTARRWPRTRP